MGRFWLGWGCFFGFLTVALGAFAQHGLAQILDGKELGWIQTANTYLAYHTFALLALGLWSHWEKWASSVVAGVCFVLGTFLFSGSLYLLAFSGLHFLVFVTPVGGLLFLVGWLSFALSIFKARSALV